MSKHREPIFDKSLSEPPLFPSQAIQRIAELLKSGRLFRYGEEDPEGSDVALLEVEFAQLTGRRYCIGMNSCGSTMFVALKAMGIESQTPVLFNAFTLAPVPGAILHADGVPIPVEIRDDLLIDLDHLASQVRRTGARHLLLSHMRGHIADLDRVVAVCKELGLTLIEDCAHTMGAAWNGRLTGTFGTVGCFSTQAFKHANSGEGGLLVTDDDELAARAILYSGSYAMYGQHRSRPALHVFEKFLGRIPNFSLRMSNLAAALIRPQLHELSERIEIWRTRYSHLAQLLSPLPEICVPERDPKEQHVPSSLQFSVPRASPEWMSRFVDECRARGVHLKWFGTPRSDGFTERLEHWQFIPADHVLPHTPRVLATLCDLRIPLSLTDEDCQTIVAVIRHALDRVGPLSPAVTSSRSSNQVQPLRESRPLWTADEIVEATKGRWIIQPRAGWSPVRVSYDIVGLEPGNLIICMHPSSWGANRPDTAQKLNQLVASGAAGAVIQPDQLGAVQPRLSDFPVLLVDSTRRALRDLARAARERFHGKVIAVTGTVGKTTCKELLRHILDVQGGAVATRANNNSVAGVERSMAYTPPDFSFSILEMGLGQPVNGIAISSRQVRPHVALITSIGLAHLDVGGEKVRNSSNPLKFIAKQKLGVLAGMSEGGILVAHHDPATLDQIRAAARSRSIRVVTFGEHPEANVRLLEFTGDSGVNRVRALIDDRVVEYSLRLPGRHMAINALGVIATVRAANANLESALHSLSEFTAVEGRAQLVEIPVGSGTALLIDDSFNATPDSVRATLKLLAEHEPERQGRRIAVLGDILHLGPASAALHSGLAEEICAQPIHRVFTIGSEMLHLHRALPSAVRGSHASSLRELEELLRAYLQPGDVLTIKASTPMGLGRLASSLKFRTHPIDTSASAETPLSSACRQSQLE